MRKIEYFLNGKSLGVSQVCEGSLPKDRISLANSTGIDYYDGFILDDKHDSRNVMINGKPIDDFKPQYSLSELNED